MKKAITFDMSAIDFILEALKIKLPIRCAICKGKLEKKDISAFVPDDKKKIKVICNNIVCLIQMRDMVKHTIKGYSKKDKKALMKLKRREVA